MKKIKKALKKPTNWREWLWWEIGILLFLIVCYLIYQELTNDPPSDSNSTPNQIILNKLEQEQLIADLEFNFVEGSYYAPTQNSCLFSPQYCHC